MEALESRTLLSGNNLITNGDFELGPTSFTTDFNYSQGNILPAGTYDVVNNPSHSRLGDSKCASYGDHTTGQGLMLAINGPRAGNQIAWSQSVLVTPQTDYSFSFCMSTWEGSVPAAFDVQFNGVSIGTPQAPSGPGGGWTSFGKSWNSGTTHGLTITIIDTTNTVDGNQFALDDISLTGPANNGTGELEMEVSSVDVKENAATVTLKVLRVNGSTGTVKVDYATKDGTALAGTNYLGDGQTLTFGSGETSKTLKISILDDNLLEGGPVTFTVNLSNPIGGATLAAPTSTQVNVTDTDLPVVANSQPALTLLQIAAANIAQSTEHYQQFVKQAYTQFLSRSPDSSGLNYWVSQMQQYQTSNHHQGLRQQDIEAGFIDSPEYLGRYGGVGSAWIQGIYQDLLGRPADSGGLQHWLDQLKAGETPKQVALDFTTSVERLKARITDTYKTLLGRSPDSQGLAYWVGVFQSGGTTEDITTGFVGSLEYYNNPNGAAGNQAKWVRQVYLDVLDRPATVAECNSWLKFFHPGPS